MTRTISKPPSLALGLRGLPGLGNVLLGIIHLTLYRAIPNLPPFRMLEPQTKDFIGFLYAAVSVAVILAGLAGILGHWAASRGRVFSLTVVVLGGAYVFSIGLIGLFHHMASAFSVLNFSFGLLQMISVLAVWFQPIRSGKARE